ncbi:MAG: LLM class flavin-dependent oxidoreductase [Actinobacteria bacterium]|jgi:alkanesulfonate monooxygenase SsuD/methylene tetrahydromethanopterin reductase-like flavin-dependent oxidoreductase (luciferase family)|nr:LLM class flavin-dependent oxidoreductase [Actinomycetota bacterium]
MNWPLMRDNGMKLGIFSANCSSGLAVTKAPDRWSGSWQDNLALARIADEVGIDFMLPIARWIGYGGDTNFHEGVLEPIPWAAGLLASTERLTVFSTIHTAFNHPLVTAKQIATIDQIAPGRAGLNVVAGWNKPEYDAFGRDLPAEHDERYAFAQEWFDVIRELWSRPGSWDHDGTYFKLTGAASDPKPTYGRVPIFNAGASSQGREFAANNADFIFTPFVDLAMAERVVASIREATAHRSREVGVLTSSHVVCRPTREEAQEFYRWYADEHADWDAVDRLMALQNMHAQSFSKEMLENFRWRFAAGHGSYPLVGSPDDVADELEAMCSTGVGGTTLAFFDYVGELPYFADEVLPRLERKGVRRPLVAA